MAELIENGFFNEDIFPPWENCLSNELGESWRCNGEEEPAFDRLHWIYSSASITDNNILFLTAFNLELDGNDGVKQIISSDFRATDDFTFWADLQNPMDDLRHWGDLYGIVCYSDHTFDFTKVTRDDIHHPPPKFVRVPVRTDKQVQKVMICVADAEAPWFVTGISMEGERSSKSLPPLMSMERRVRSLEKKVDAIYHAIARSHREKTVLAGKGKTKTAPGNKKK